MLLSVGGTGILQSVYSIRYLDFWVSVWSASTMKTVYIQTASDQELQTLPGLSPIDCEAILEARKLQKLTVDDLAVITPLPLSTWQEWLHSGVISLDIPRDFSHRKGNREELQVSSSNPSSSCRLRLKLLYFHGRVKKLEAKREKLLLKMKGSKSSACVLKESEPPVKKDQVEVNEAHPSRNAQGFQLEVAQMGTGFGNALCQLPVDNVCQPTVKMDASCSNCFSASVCEKSQTKKSTEGENMSHLRSMNKLTQEMPQP